MLREQLRVIDELTTGELEAIGLDTGQLLTLYLPEGGSVVPSKLIPWFLVLLDSEGNELTASNGAVAVMDVRKIKDRRNQRLVELWERQGLLKTEDPKYTRERTSLVVGEGEWEEGRYEELYYPLSRRSFRAHYDNNGRLVRFMSLEHDESVYNYPYDYPMEDEDIMGFVREERDS